MHQELPSGDLISVQRAKPQARSHPDGEWTTAIYKLVVNGPVAATSEGLEGDGVADRKHHGGVDKAVLAYSVDNYPRWQEELDHEFENGAFGENLSIRGLDESNVCVGDHWRIGEVLFEVSQPRQPCWKLARRWNDITLPKLVVQNGRSGWYLRVLESGSLKAGDSVDLEKRTYAEWTIGRVSRVFYGKDLAEKKALAQVETLADAWKTQL